MKTPTITNTLFGVVAIAGACLLLTSCGDPGGTHQGESAPKIETASAPSGVPHAPDNSPVVTGTVTKKTFDPLKHVSGIFPNSSRQSDVTASFGNPETVETAKGGVVRTQLGVLPYGGERVLKYDSVGLRFSIHRDDVDQADPVMNEVNASRKYSGTSKMG